MKELGELQAVASVLVIIQDFVRSSINEALNCKTISDAEPHLKDINKRVNQMVQVVQERAGLIQKDDIDSD